MGLEDVEADIKKRIETKVTSIKKSAETEANQIIDEAKAKIKDRKKARDLEIQTISEEIKNREIATASLSAKKLKMVSKKDAIESVYSRVKEKLKKLDQQEKKDVLSALIGKAKQELADVKYVMCNSADEKIVEGIAKKLGLQMGGNLDCFGGIVVENSDRTIRVDYTFDSLLEQFNRNSLKEVAQQLFTK